MSRCGLLFSFAVLALVQSGPPRQPSCVPPARLAVLPDPMPQLAGKWAFELMAGTRITDSFRMELRAADSATQTSIHILDGKLHRDSSYLYYGVIDRPNDTIPDRRAQEFSWDPDRPGVRARFHPQFQPAFRFIVGMDNNDRTKISFDGWHFWLEPRSMSERAMTGSWSAGVFVAGLIESGWWCARRIP